MERLPYPLPSKSTLSPLSRRWPLVIAAGIGLLGSARAAQFGDFTYTDDGTSITITDYPTAATGPVEIPETIDGKPVTVIGFQAFRDCGGITSMTIPSHVTTIRQSAFYDCSSLGSVSIPPSVTSIGDAAFSRCPGLRSVTIPSARVGAIAFQYCVSLTSVTFLSGSNIGMQAFSIGCYALRSAIFMADAPLIDSSVFPTDSGFAVYYLNGASGFTTPVWHGYPSFPGVSPQFTSAPPPATGELGKAYAHSCTATGAPAPTFAVTAGALPGGLVLSANGEFAGSPDVEGVFTGTITAHNGFPPDTTQDFLIDTREWVYLTSEPFHGTVAGAGKFLPNAITTLAATPDPGYLFTGWTGDATGTDNPLSVIMDADKTITATFTPDTSDDDDDGLTNFQEIVETGTDPTKPDTDGDGAKDGADAFPHDPVETLDTDRDGTGDNADTDDDGDGYSDEDEITIHHTNPKRADSDGDGLSDPAEIETHSTNPNVADTDNDGLRDGEEFTTYHTDPLVGDSDGDGFLDGYEVLTGKLPLDIADKPALVAEARTAIEFTFPAAVGKIYQIEVSSDLAVWEIVETGIAGTGGQVQRFYSTRGMPTRYFRVEEQAP